jgi:hypothetical protein
LSAAANCGFEQINFSTIVNAFEQSKDAAMGACGAAGDVGCVSAVDWDEDVAAAALDTGATEGSALGVRGFEEPFGGSKTKIEAS